MKKTFILLIMALVMMSCHPKKTYKVIYPEGTSFCYVDTDEGRLWGIGNEQHHFMEPVYDTIVSVLDQKAYYASEKGVWKLYDIAGSVLCDGAELVSYPEFSSEYGGLGKQGKYIRVQTNQGIYGVYYSSAWAQWYCYGPFKEYIAGVTGYMFQDPQSGKWGVGKYGTWRLDENNLIAERRGYLIPGKEVLIPAQYEKIVNISHYYSYKTHWALGYKDKSDVRWYCYDGNQWLGFDIDGNSIAVNQKELQQALGKKTRRSIYLSGGKAPTQRLGIEEASLLLIQH